MITGRSSFRDVIIRGRHAKPRPGGDETGRDRTRWTVPDATKDENQELHTVQIKNKEYKKNLRIMHTHTKLKQKEEGRKKKKNRILPQTHNSNSRHNHLLKTIP